MSKWDKLLIIVAFKINRKKNNKCIIFIAINIYNIGIGNPDIRLVIQWDFFIRFNAIIQYMGYVRKKNQQFTFVLLTSNWTQVKSPKEIEKILAK